MENIFKDVSKLNARVWVGDGEDFTFAERIHDEGALVKNTGVCFS